MFEPNVQKLLAALTPADVVLDVGGWACPFNRANWVMDAQPFSTRGFYRTFGGPPSQGGEREWFTEQTWIQRDICDKRPFPFEDKQIDFAICSHTLEDIRDPLWVCAELVRVAKRGYIEVPSREWESSRGHEGARQVGLSHHRWLIDIGQNRLQFLMKYHTIHSHWRFSFPASYRRSLPPERCVQWLWWEHSFDCEEVTIHGLPGIVRELERFVEVTHPYPAWRLAFDRQVRAADSLARRAANKLRRTLAG